jgi:hypothetical protein
MLSLKKMKNELQLHIKVVLALVGIIVAIVIIQELILK